MGENTLSNFQAWVDVLREQLEAEDFIGGRWLPIENQFEHAAIRPALDQAGQKSVDVDNNTKKPRRYSQEAAEEVMNTRNKTTSRSKRTAIHATQNNSEDIVEKKRQKLAEIEHELKTCHDCPLHETRTHVVPGKGHPDARIMFIGEAPGQKEDEKGEPFVGRAGDLLTKIVQAMGLQRDEVFIGNILKCRPPGNRDPQTSEIAACIGYLHRQINVIEPEILVALGSYAARTLLDTQTAIGQLRGKIHEYQPEPLSRPIKLIATYHPAYLLRNYTPDARQKVWQDMQRVLKELDLPIPEPKKK